MCTAASTDKAAPSTSRTIRIGSSRAAFSRCAALDGLSQQNCLPRDDRDGAVGKQVEAKGAINRRHVWTEELHDVHCADDGREQLLTCKIERDVIAVFVVKPLAAHPETADSAPRAASDLLGESG